jgi:hypothetical protein
MASTATSPGVGGRAWSRSAPRATSWHLALLVVGLVAAGCGGGGRDLCDGACVCESESECDFVCDADGCAAVCQDTSTCVATCDDRCDLTCVDTSDCDLACDDVCRVTCDRVSTCTVDCGVDCDVSCTDLSTCDVVMVSGVARCAGVSECTIGCRVSTGIVSAFEEAAGVWVCP